MQELEVGESATLQARFVTAAGVLTNPTVVTLTHTDPSGNATTVLQAALTNVSAGVWTYALTVDEAGVWQYRFEGTGAVVAGETNYLLVAAEGASGGLSGPCEDWIDAGAVFDCSPCSGIAAASQDWGLAASVATAASRILYLLSDRKYPGVCDTTIRPFACHCGQRVCGCPRLEEIRLSPGPVLWIAEVRVNGSVIAATSYEVHHHRMLVRTDNDVWPSWQDFDADPATEDDTFQVRYFYGVNPPEDGQRAAKLLACEMYQACSGADSCTLPSSVQSIVRQGVEIGFEPAETLFSEGRTGIREVDRFLSTERYASANLPTAIASPDWLPTYRKVTG